MSQKISQPNRWVHTPKVVIEAVVGFEEWMKNSKERFKKFHENTVNKHK